MPEFDLEALFTYHSPKPEDIPKYQDIRTKARELADLIIHCAPSSRERSLAMTKIEESVMWANAAIARNSER